MLPVSGPHRREPSVLWTHHWISIIIENNIEDVITSTIPTIQVHKHTSCSILCGRRYIIVWFCFCECKNHRSKFYFAFLSDQKTDRELQYSMIYTLYSTLDLFTVYRFTISEALKCTLLHNKCTLSLKTTAPIRVQYFTSDILCC